jgi:hypothetical protein
VNLQGRPLPARVGRFRIDGVIDQDRTSAGYRAVDPLLQRIVAIKVISSDVPGLAALERIRRGAEASVAR